MDLRSTLLHPKDPQFPWTRAAKRYDDGVLTYDVLTLWQAFEKDAESQEFLSDVKVKQKFASALKLSDVDVSKYAAIFYVGGHGPVIDLPTDSDNIRVAEAVRQNSCIHECNFTDPLYSFTRLESQCRQCAMDQRE